MSGTAAEEPLPDPRRIVTAHTDGGLAVVDNDALIPAQESPECRSGSIWVTADSVPTNDTNTDEDGAMRALEDEHLGLFHPNGTNFRYTDIAPGSVTPMHRTPSLDYNILVQGELILMMEDGTEKHLKNPGDVVIQRGTLHAWKNPGRSWARWITVLIAAQPHVVRANGETLHSRWVPNE